MADLTQDQIAQLMQMYRNGGFSTGANIGGQYLAPIGVQGAGEDNGMNTLQGFTGFDPQTIANQQAQYGRIMPNTQGSIYGVNGGYGGSYKTQDDNPDGIQKAVLAAIIAASAGAASGFTSGTAIPGSTATIGADGLGAAAGGGGLGGGVAAGGAGVLGDTTAMGYDPMFGAATEGMPNTAAMGAAGGGGAGASGYTLGADALPGVSTMSPSTIAGAASPIGMGAGGGGALSSLASTLGVSPSLLTGGISLLGGLLGSKGVQTQQTGTKDIPEWLKPYVGQQLNYASGLLDKQMSPQYQQAADQIRTQSMGLLAPQQQTNFGRFFPGK
jgi:hypothetical protein